MMSLIVVSIQFFLLLKQFFKKNITFNTDKHIIQIRLLILLVDLNEIFQILDTYLNFSKNSFLRDDLKYF